MLIDIMLPSGNTEKNALNRIGVDNDVAFATSAFLGRVFHGVCFGELGSGARIDICRQAVSVHHGVLVLSSRAVHGAILVRDVLLALSHPGPRRFMTGNFYLEFE